MTDQLGNCFRRIGIIADQIPHTVAELATGARDLGICRCRFCATTGFQAIGFRTGIAALDNLHCSAVTNTAQACLRRHIADGLIKNVPDTH